MRSSTRNQETTANTNYRTDMSLSTQQHGESDGRHQLSRIPTRLPQNMDSSKRERHKAKKEIKVNRGVATSTLPATRYKWPSEPQNRVQFVKADYLVSVSISIPVFSDTYIFKEKGRKRHNVCSKQLSLITGSSLSN